MEQVARIESGEGYIQLMQVYDDPGLQGLYRQGVTEAPEGAVGAYYDGGESTFI